MENERLPLITFCDFGSENGKIKAACRLDSSEANFEPTTDE